MAFTPEDGTGVTGANAYIDAAFADAYFADRGGNADWTGADTATKQASIVQASDYLDGQYGHRYRGTKSTATQGLLWPRVWAKDDSGDALTGVPEQLKRACAELAERAVTGALLPDPPQPVSGGAPAATGVIVRKRERVEGVVEEETEYAHSAMGSEPDYPAVDALLRELLHPAGELVRM